MRRRCKSRMLIRCSRIAGAVYRRVPVCLSVCLSVCPTCLVVCLSVENRMLTRYSRIAGAVDPRGAAASLRITEKTIRAIKQPTACARKGARSQECTGLRVQAAVQPRFASQKPRLHWPEGAGHGAASLRITEAETALACPGFSPIQQLNPARAQGAETALA
jgi:hypothetical protein